MLEETIWNVGDYLGGWLFLSPECLMPAGTSSRVDSASAQLSSASSSLMKKTGKVPPSPWAPRPAPEPPRLSGVYGIEAATLWDLACFYFGSQLCLVSTDLTSRFLRALPP